MTLLTYMGGFACVVGLVIVTGAAAAAGFVPDDMARILYGAEVAGPLGAVGMYAAQNGLGKETLTAHVHDWVIFAIRQSTTPKAALERCRCGARRERPMPPDEVAPWEQVTTPST